MRTKALHTNTKLFFSDPYVVRLEYKNIHAMFQEDEDYRKITRATYKLIEGTWGYSKLVNDVIRVKNEHGHLFPPGPHHFDGMTQSQTMASLFDPDWQTVRRGYFCFKDELDALQFRLTINVNAVQVVMWPKNILFTIHEVTETNDTNNASNILVQT